MSASRGRSPRSRSVPSMTTTARPPGRRTRHISRSEHCGSAKQLTQLHVTALKAASGQGSAAASPATNLRLEIEPPGYLRVQGREQHRHDPCGDPAQRPGWAPANSTPARYPRSPSPPRTGPQRCALSTATHARLHGPSQSPLGAQLPLSRHTAEGPEGPIPVAQEWPVCALCRPQR